MEVGLGSQSVSRTRTLYGEQETLLHVLFRKYQNHRRSPGGPDTLLP